MVLHKNKLFVYFSFLVGVTVVIWAPSVLPEKYYYDSQIIMDVIQMQERNYGGDYSFSYENIGKFYRLIGLLPGFFSYEFISIIAYTLAFIATILPVFLSQRKLRLIEYFILAVWLSILAIYCGQYSKELIATVSISVLAIQFKHLHKNKIRSFLIILSVFCLMTILLRPYWILILGFFTLFSGGLIFSWDKRIIILLFLFALVSICFMYHELEGSYLSDARVMLNLGREFDKDSVTAINNYFENSSPVTDMLNILFNWFTLVFPFKLISYGSLQHNMFFLLQIGTLVYIYRTYITLSHLLERNAAKRARFDILCPLLFILSFTIVQGMFEPDYGSFLKHLVTLAPILVVIFMNFSQSRFLLRVADEYNAYS